MDNRKDILTIKPKELKRLQVIRKVIDQQINQQQAADYLDLSDRQVRRIVRRVREQGDSGVIHRLRNQPSCHRIDQKIRQKIVEVYREKYGGFGPTLASEKLLEKNKLKICDETLRLWLIKEGLWKAKKQRKKNKRAWRVRKDHAGEMVQMDGSHHDWLEGRGPELVLMGYVDDATGRAYGRFYEYEGTQPAMDSLKAYIRRYGLPKSIYLDKHSTYKINKAQRYKEWPFRDKGELTQFARACQQLGIELIYAHSPQAKGRIERMFGTFQDRLVKELRLAEAKTLKQANRLLANYLPKFNKRFNVVARESGDLHRSPSGIDLDEILSIQVQHVLRNDRTVLHQKQLYQVLNRTRARNVIVHEYLNGRMAIKSGTNRLAYKPIEKSPTRNIVPKAKPRKRYVPPKGSYWRDGFKLTGSLR